MAYLGLFWTSFLAATFLPLSSEGALLGLMYANYDSFYLWWAAVTGNTLGGMLNWWLGGYLLHFQQASWFPFKTRDIIIAQAYFQRFGTWSLLFSWLPIIGDGLTFVAGVMRIPLWLFVVLVFIGKGLRYIVLISGFQLLGGSTFSAWYGFFLCNFSGLT